MRCLLPAVLLLLQAVPSAAQQLPVLDPAIANLIAQEVSGDAAYEHVRHNTQFHRPGGGAPGLMEVARYYEAKAREYGLTDVQLIRQAHTTPPWEARGAELWTTGPAPERIASWLQTPLHLADYSRATDVTAQLVDVGAGATARDYEGRSVAGQLVLAYGPLGTVMQEAVWRRGAAGIVWYPNPYADRNVSYPDQVNWSRVPVRGPQGEAATFAFVLSLRQGLALRERLAAGPLQLRARVDAGFDETETPWQVMVEAYIRGSEPGLHQDVVITSHMQEEKFSANDDGSGTGAILEVARALNHLIEEGVIPRPRRNLRFWWLTEISSQRQYFADHPDAHRSMWVNINQDMVGANQAQDVMRVQNVTRLPASRFHFFNDVVESVIEYMVATNNSELAQSQAGSGALYTRPHMARLGTRHRYNAKLIFFHNNTDHMPFNEAPIGVPGITFTNWPDHYIHTTDDDLWNIDRTQLGRNAAAAALMAYAMSSADAQMRRPCWRRRPWAAARSAWRATSASACRGSPRRPMTARARTTAQCSRCAMPQSGSGWPWRRWRPSRRRQRAWCPHCGRWWTGARPTRDANSTRSTGWSPAMRGRRRRSAHRRRRSSQGCGRSSWRGPSCSCSGAAASAVYRGCTRSWRSR
jgi:hypothetical protein